MPRTSGGAFTFMIPGTAVVGTSQAGALVPDAFTVSHVKVYSETAPVGATLFVDVNVNGTSLWNVTQANRPGVLTTAKSANSGIPDTGATLAAGDRITVDVDAVGSTTAGGGPLFVTVVLV